MKIEKLTENKIRVIVAPSDLSVKNLDIKLLMNKALEEQNFFTDVLEKAKKEVGFDADGCKLLIEAFSSLDDILVFTITKYSPSHQKNSVPYKKKLRVKRKDFDFSSSVAVYQFEDFDTFCDFCKCFNGKSNFDIKKVSKNFSLYLYNDTYYLLVKNIDVTYYGTDFFCSTASEFSKLARFSNSFENKLLEHGKVIIKKNAISTAVKYFAY